MTGQAIGPYRILELDAEDELGLVYLAEHPRLGARVAVKVLSHEPALSPDAIERFFREARAVNALRHERIVDIVDLGTLDDGRAFIVTEHLEGAALSRLLEERGPLPLGALARLTSQVLAAVAAAHDHGIVHGALSPERVFVTTTGHAKVRDFGLASLAPGSDERTRRSRQLAAARALRYRAPEQATGEADPRADLYAIGALLFEGATGAPPFDGATISEVRRRQIEAAPAVRSLRDSVPPALEALIQRALATDPEERFATAREMAIALADAAISLPPEEPLLVQPLPAAVLRVRPGERAVPPWLLLAVLAAFAAATLGVLALAF